MTGSIDGAAIIRALRCECGKIHCCAYVGPASECTCGRRLWALVWRSGR